ncbi:uncharacterized protein PV06_09985 [Exophiala oligosperma]|uniref:Ubiquitin 3 binding protein But2 C-terminal domain-containing protein n=2 Tax=Chaetothyriales TaxID=34395 RepID=A0A0D2DQE6_9EURO|nr:uncharacterized protein PV06_09985 [Exophiala oligosperma]KAJ9639263.1 hypothetical protein H2204_003874 [Knufia peltigerae]KIW38009.1 hypothetical protein PV06_09985 [Exophiala oligosperma]
MQVKTAVLASIPALALAAPTGSSGQNPAPDLYFPAVYGLIVGTDVQPFHFESFNANSGKFWLNLPETSTSCPFTGTDQASNCPPGTDTAFVGSGSLATVVPGGQQVYVAPNGALSFTAAHSGAMPEGSVVDPFIFVNVGGEYGEVTTSAFGADGFMACPTHGSIAYQVFANFDGAQVPLGNVQDCVAVTPLAVPYTQGQAAAWQYN